MATNINHQCLPPYVHNPAVWNHIHFKSPAPRHFDGWKTVCCTDCEKEYWDRKERGQGVRHLMHPTLAYMVDKKKKKSKGVKK